ncbi:10681_t:CDS:2 [Ambispora leptoticha]|uniref:10681_t:CDS:1 n=1 Tax=Ambispora leptoticha TaxID=144679 RepID=A0A9N8VQ42_9GLOM|nr:10681_t:CDS:2 [Ambispora leptoticha]
MKNILVAEIFISNLENKHFVNHINSIKTNNQADNLEWVTSKENNNRKIFPNSGCSRSRKVIQVGLDGNVIQIWNLLSLVQDTLNIHKSAISMYYNKKRNSAGGWYWMYYEKYTKPDSNEEWKEIEFDSEKFKVSSLGRVQTVNGMIIQGSLLMGYLKVGRGLQSYMIQHLVALAFSSKEQGKDYVNHIDGNPTNNKALNLEWCTQKENIQHAVRLELCNNDSNKHAIKQIFADGSFQEFSSLTEAYHATGINHNRISLVYCGIQTYAGGYHWEFVETNNT